MRSTRGPLTHTPRFSSSRRAYELYDWPFDYFEQHDLYEEQARAPEVAHLQSLLGVFVQKYWRPAFQPAPTSRLANVWTSFFAPKARAIQH
ncbi:MAG: hypothetical protein ABTD50_00085 [Polyangiaceae bacterium]